MGVLAGALTQSGCAGGGEDSGPPPAITLVAPAEEATVCGDPLLIEIAVEDFPLIPLEEGADSGRKGGHVDLYLNGQAAAMMDTTTASLDAIDEGLWQIKVELSKADHSPVTPYVNDLAYFTVDPAACAAVTP